MVCFSAVSVRIYSTALDPVFIISNGKYSFTHYSFPFSDCDCHSLFIILLPRPNVKQLLESNDWLFVGYYYFHYYCLPEYLNDLLNLAILSEKELATSNFSNFRDFY